MTESEYIKQKIAFRYWISGQAEFDSSYYAVLIAMDVAEKYHNGLRKDGSPEFSHQIAICSYLRTLHKYFIDPVSVFIVALLHDTYEDYPESEKELFELFPKQFDMIVRISKIRNGEKIPYSEYFSDMSDCFVVSIVKLADRIANISTMVGVFSTQKQDKYLQDLDDWFFPMLKTAKHFFPQQEPAYQNLKSMLSMQKDTILKVRIDCSSN
jgi:(p)ppGpp synthase/HD superfamily hydrolase